jgi:MarR family transcriptional regulator, lower aerobic nicotinate degradation pathway regulator
LAYLGPSWLRAVGFSLIGDDATEVGLHYDLSSPTIPVCAARQLLRIYFPSQLDEGKPAVVVPELSAHLGYWLRQVSNHVSYGFAHKLAARDITVAEWMLMRVLYGRQPLSPSQVADEMGMTRGAITKLAALADQNEAECFGYLTADDRHMFERILKETVARLGLTASPVD